jgi:hypothetical protein
MILTRDERFAVAVIQDISEDHSRFQNTDLRF